MARRMMDIALGDDGDLLFASGDFNVVESTNEHQKQLLLNDKGSFKESPTICVGAFGYLDDEGYGNLQRDTAIEFTRDGMQVNRIQLNNGKIDVDASYQ